jgi:DNA processing protein
VREDLEYWVALIHIPKFGPRALQRLFAHFGNMQAAWQSKRDELLALGLTVGAVDSFIHLRGEINPAELMDELARNNIQAITVEDENYPTRLKNIYDPPTVLFVRGELPPPTAPHLAVVGSRHLTPYGAENARNFSRDLAEAGVVIVSGLAYGVDEQAHRSTLEAHGRTIAVLASGLLNIGTSRQRYLAEQIINQGGAVISEFAPRTASLKTHFPIRNRVISGLCQATLVIEAAVASGSLITARCALDQGRDVYAVPGPINSPTSAGTNQLIKNGAGVITSAQDLLEALALAPVTTAAATVPRYQPRDQEEAAVLQLLSANPVHLDEIIRETKLTTTTVIKTLTIMELQGHARQLSGNYYILS